MKKDYVDNDVAYFLGMLFARGTLAEEQGGIKRIIIGFPYINQEFTFPPGRAPKIDRAISTKLFIERIRSRVSELTGADFQTIERQNDIDLVGILTKNTIAWRDIRMLARGSSYADFTLDSFVFDWPADILIDFVRGYVDVAAIPSHADHDQVGRERIVLQIQQANWYFPLQLCWILQQRLNVKVEHILWGHPNVRTPYDSNSKSWAKEHRLRIPVEAFVKIGFNWDFKQKVLDKLVSFDKARGYKIPRILCNPKAKRVPKKKPKHPGEKDARLPKELLGRHCDSASQICTRLGCNQGFKTERTETLIEE